MRLLLRSLCLAALGLAVFMAGRYSRKSEPFSPPAMTAPAPAPHATLPAAALPMDRDSGAAGHAENFFIASPMPALPARPLTWETLEHQDYGQFVSNLRAFGCPEEVIRDLVVAEVFCRAAGRATAGGGPWNALLSLWPDVEQARRVTVEANQILGRAVLALATSSIAEPASVAAAGVEVDYVTRMNALWSGLNGAALSPSEEAAVHQLEEERRAALLRFFSLAELERYEFERSGELDDMKRDFARIEPSNEEAVLLARMRSSDEGPSSDDVQQLAALLGQERFGIYQEILREHGREAE